MAPADTVFLDTTVLADRIFGRRTQRHAIDEKLVGKQVLASKYVREQFRATFLRAMVQVYNQLRELRDPVELLRRTDNYQFFQTGEGVKARKILCAVLEHPELDVDDMLDHLERSIEHDLMADFDALCDIVDDTSCCLCSSKPEKDEHGIFRFEKSCTLADPRPCRIEDFWAKHENELKALAAASDPDVPRAALEAAREASAGERPRGKRCYVGLSDSVIVAESPPGSTLLTTNQRDFVPLARVLGRERSVAGYPSY
jgi:predicted nucleic acid-binding protein